MGDCQARFREKGGWNSLHLLDRPLIYTNFNGVAPDLRQKSSIFAPDLKQMRMFRRNIISKLEAWKQDKKHKKSPARNRVGDVCVIKLTLCQLQRADALSYLLNGTIENAFLLCIERVNMTTNLWAVETLREPCSTFAEVFLCDVSKWQQLIIILCKLVTQC